MEKDLEKKLVRATERAGGLALKFFAQNFTGLPDRILLLPGGRIGFAEVKEPGKKPTARQLYVHRILRRLGFKVFTLNASDQIPAIIREISNTTNQPHEPQELPRGPDTGAHG